MKKVDWRYNRPGLNDLRQGAGVPCAEEGRDGRAGGREEDAPRAEGRDGNAEGGRRPDRGSGKKVERLDLEAKKPDKATIERLMLGPTGNLRAPTLRVGRTLLVGFDEETYRKVLA